MRRALLVLTGLAAPLAAQNAKSFTHADTLRGSNGPARAWWDVQFYDLHVRVQPADSTISGWSGIAYRVLRPAREMQIDLQDPLQIDSVLQGRTRLRYRRDGSAYFVTLPVAPARGTVGRVTVYYHGRPVVAVRPPWQGGFTWAKDSLGHTWVATSNEGLGASVWWPNKDYLADEPDSQRIAITVPDSLFDVSNGRLRSVTPNGDGTTTWEWFVTSPINNYDVAVDAGPLAHFGGVYDGEAGPLTLDFWPLAIHLDTARVQFQQVTAMLKCFEHWFGPYPFYADGYKLVEAPHLGMEHQSAVAYGNHYMNGYLGRDLSGTGTGLTWDFIIVHESAHEWWGNNITMQDQADMWIHEGFANYAENLFVECQQGKAAGARYVIGTRRGIRNQEPIIAPYGVNADPPGDQYPKGGNLLHTIRQVVNDDAKWRGILRGLNHTFWHQTVTSAQVEAYISREAGIDLRPVFDQYLRTTQIPVLEYQLAGDTLAYRWANVVPGFALPLRVTLADTSYGWIHPTAVWQRVAVRLSRPDLFKVDENFYVETKAVLAGKGGP
jgi:aminopeptidase N